MRILEEHLRGLSNRVLEDRGLSDEDAGIVTDILVEAELRGRATHGMIRLPGIADRISEKPRQAMKLSRDGAAYALIDGQENLGYLVAHRAARTAIGRADRSGVGLVGAHNTSHCGMLGYYVSMIADAGMVGMAMCNTNPRIVPTGGAEPVLGTNPIAAAFPAVSGQILVDLAAAAITNGEILLAIKDGHSIPDGLAVGADGRTTMDPEAARTGGALPFGGHKGYALAVMIQMFTGVMMGGSPVPEPGQDYGLFVMAIDPQIFLDKAEFDTAVVALVDRVKSSRRADGVAEILIPGERAYRERVLRQEEGLDIDDDVMAQIQQL